VVAARTGTDPSRDRRWLEYRNAPKDINASQTTLAPRGLKHQNVQV